jgi:hypothetical protein
MKVTVLLADSAQTDQNGKIHALGLGWTFTVSPTPPLAVVLLIDVEWTETNEKFEVKAELVTADGAAISGEGPAGPIPVAFAGVFEVGRPPGLPHGTPVRLPIAVNLGPGLPLVPGQRYVWRVSVDGVHEDGWDASFLIRDAQPGQQTPQ